MPSIDQLGLDDGTKLVTILRRFYPLLLKRAYADAGVTLDMDLAFDVDNPAVQRVLEQLAKQVKGVSDTTRATIQALIGKQASEGWSAEELAQQLREHGVTREREPKRNHRGHRDG